jgi:cellulose biosynthesis protein BcsQ
VIGTEEVTDAWLESEVKPAILAAQRTIFDLGSASDNLLPEIFGLCGIMLITLLPDLNSTLTVSRIEASLKTMQSSGEHTPTAFYIFNRFDELNPKHQQAGVLVARQCGDRLLQITIRRSPEVAEALAEGMTVSDYAPESEVTRDYLDLALWLRKVAPARDVVISSGRWSER